MLITPYLLAWFALVLYLVASIIQGLILKNQPIAKHWVWIVGVTAIGFHAYWLHGIIDLPEGQNVNFLNLLSFLLWLMSTMILLIAARKPILSLSIFIFPFSSFVLLLTLLFPLPPVLRTMAGHPHEWLHVCLATLTFAIIGIAALQSLLLYCQDLLLRHSSYLPITWLKKMPPLDSMESLLFQIIGVGVILLTSLGVSSIYFFPAVFQFPLLKKTILTMIVWGILCILLVGRYQYGWRGRKAVIYTMVGFFAMILIYFGNQS